MWREYRRPPSLEQFILDLILIIVDCHSQAAMGAQIIHTVFSAWRAETVVTFQGARGAAEAESESNRWAPKATSRITAAS